jgi:hypothetical protein
MVACPVVAHSHYRRATPQASTEPIPLGRSAAPATAPSPPTVRNAGAAHTPRTHPRIHGA